MYKTPEMIKKIALKRTGIRSWHREKAKEVPAFQYLQLTAWGVRKGDGARMPPELEGDATGTKRKRKGDATGTKRRRGRGRNAAGTKGNEKETGPERGRNEKGTKPECIYFLCT